MQGRGTRSAFARIPHSIKNPCPERFRPASRLNSEVNARAALPSDRRYSGQCFPHPRDGRGGGFRVRHVRHWRRVLMAAPFVFLGIPPAVAVASVASHIAASSFSGAISYWRRRAIDPALALVLLSGGTGGTALGGWTFTLLRSLGQLDLMIALSYVVLLTTVGGLMFWEGLRSILRVRRGVVVPMRRSGSHGWIHGLPLKMRFKRSKIYLSVIPIVVVGVVIGFIGAVMGIGGGFILIPIMIYLLRVPTSTVIGTSMVLTLVTMVFATMLHAVTNHLVDAVLALILMVGGVTGAQFGARAGQKIRGEHLRLLLGLLILAVGIRFAVELVLRPDDLFTIRESGGPGGPGAPSRFRLWCWRRGWGQ